MCFVAEINFSVELLMLYIRVHNFKLLLSCEPFEDYNIHLI